MVFIADSRTVFVLDSFENTSETSEVATETVFRNCKKRVLRKFANFTEKQLCLSLFLIELQTFRPVTLLKKDSNTDIFL